MDIIDGKEKVGKFYFIQPTSSGIPIADTKNIPQVVKWEAKVKESRKVFLSYLFSGISWSPSYTMDILSDNKVRWRYNVAISNCVLPISKVKVKLVSGMIGKVQESYGQYRADLNTSQRAVSEFAAGAMISLPTLEATRINAYYVYDLGQMENLEKGVNYVTLLDKDLEAEKEFVWATASGEKVDVIYTVKNSSEQPFAVGITDAYQDGIYMGSDTIEWTPSGSDGHVTIGGAVDIQVKKSVNITEIPEKKHNDEYHHEIELKIENFSKKDAKIKVIDNKYPDCVDIAFSLKPKEEKAQTYLWEIKLMAGEPKTIKYDFYSDSVYSEPYRAYR